MRKFLILDEQFRKNHSLQLSELALKGVEIVSSLEEVFRICRDNCEVVAMESFLASTSQNDINLYLKNSNIKFILFSNNTTIISSYKYIMDIVSIPYKNVTHIEILAAFNKDSNILEDKVEDEIDILSLFTKLSSSKDPNFQQLLDSIRFLVEENKSLKNKIKEYKRDNEEISSVVFSSLSDNQTLTTKLNSLTKQAELFNKNYHSYLTILSNNIYTNINTSNYPKCPNILYFKQFNDFLHLFSFIKTVHQSLINVLFQNVKTVFIHDSIDSIILDRVPEYYVKFTTTFSESAVSEADYMTVCNYTNLLSYILTNNLNLDYLIVVDCKRHNSSVLSGKNLQRYNLCRTEGDIDRYNLNPEVTVCNFTDSNMVWSSEDYYEELTEEERFNVLKSRECISEILSNCTNL